MKDLELLVEDIVRIPPINGRVDANLIKAIIHTESDWRIDIVSEVGAVGLMQVTFVALTDVNVKYNFNFKLEDLKNPEINILVGTTYFCDLLNYWRNKEKKKELALNWAIMSYNWGLGNVRKWLYSKGDNAVIDEAVPEQTKAHFLDTLFWYSYYSRKNNSMV
jgi:soluble lytic murein transglycosylase